MALILTSKKKSTFRNWYQKNKERLSAKRKKRYAEDPEYRHRAIEASRRRRKGERTLTGPPDDAPILFGEAAKSIGSSVSTLHGWKNKKLFPEPKRFNGHLWFSEKQVVLLMKLREVIRMYGKRRGKVKWERLNEVMAFISANWD